MASRREFLWAAALWLATGYLVCVSNELADRLAAAAALSEPGPLPDVLLALVPRWQGRAWLADACALALVALLAWRTRRAATAPLQVWASFLRMYAWAMVARATTVPLTSLPAVHPGCAPAPAQQNGWLALAPVRALQAGLLQASCHDLMFSGHAAAMLLLALTLAAEPGPPPRWTARLGGALCALGLFALLAARVHYSTDVAVAGWLAFFLWKWHEPDIVAAWQGVRLVDLELDYV